MQQNFEMFLVEPVQPPAAYIGGKKELAQRIALLIEQIPHRLYAEPFIGMGGVFFRRRYAPKCEVINDISGDIINLFRILQRHYPQFMDTLKFQVTSRREFERLAQCNPDTLTDLEKAARFPYLQRVAFGGKVRRLDRQETEARRILDPNYPTKLQNMEQALSVLGKQVIVSIKNAA